MQDTRKTRTRVLFGIFAFLLGGGMLLYLVPQGPATGEASPETVATVGDQTISAAEIRQQLSEISQRNQIPKQFQSIYTQQILNQLIFEKALEFEAKRLGIRVTDEERAERIRQYLPTAYNGDSFIGYDRYSAEVQSRFQMPVAKFEEVIGQGLLMEKFRKLVTDGISAGPDVHGPMTAKMIAPTLPLPAPLDPERDIMARAAVPVEGGCSLRDPPSVARWAAGTSDCRRSPSARTFSPTAISSRRATRTCED